MALTTIIETALRLSSVRLVRMVLFDTAAIATHEQVLAQLTGSG